MINPFSDILFLSQKRIRAISRNNPVLDFTQEMHPGLNSLMLGAETTEVGKQFQVLTVLGKNEYE